MLARRILALVLLLLAALAPAQDVAKWSAKVGNGRVEITGEIEKGWHVYSTVLVPDGPFPTTVKFDGQPTKGPWTEVGVKREMDPNFGKEVGFWAERAALSAPASVAPKKIEIQYQACDDKQCLPPKTVAVPILADAAPAPAPPANAPPSGLLPFFLAAVAAGFVALLTPCVFPMIPITVSVFSKQSDGKPLGRALAFCGGIIATFTLLGLGVSILFGAAGLQNFANNAWLNLFLGALFVVLALSLFGVFELTIPGQLANRVDTQGKGALVGPVLMGLVFSLTSFTCTMPFVGTLLVGAAQGDRLFPLVGMLGFSGAFAVPFFLLALFPSLAAKLPRSGGWLATVKAGMGFLELAAALKFFSTFDLALGLGWLTKPVFLAVWSVLAFGAGVYLLGWMRIPTVPDGKIGWLRRGFGVACLGLGGWVLAAQNGTPLRDLDAFVPPDPYPFRSTAPGAVAHTEEGWIPTYEAALAEARKQNRNVFVDFTGVYCTNCRYMERNVFPDPRVRKEFDRFVLARLFTDRPDVAEDQRNQALKIELTKTVANPVYALVRPDGTLVAQIEYERDVDTFLAFLAKG